VGEGRKIADIKSEPTEAVFKNYTASISQFQPQHLVDIYNISEEPSASTFRVAK
jgi:hypothetical protein